MSTTQVQMLLVTCIKLSGVIPNDETITHLGVNGVLWSKDQIIAELESPYQRYGFYTDVGGSVAVVVVSNGPSGKYLRTWADGVLSNNLLALPRCS